ncbi:MAG: hypothetical protein M3268_00700, partial [Acidobacteriota bacterium]|nr:hypothetical protein [Acidobacteriota bacterium]
STLTDIVGQAIYDSQVPQTSTFYVLGDVFDGGGSVNGNGTAILAATPLLLWRVVKKGQINDQQRSAALIMHTVLHNNRIALSNGWAVSISRERLHRRTYYDAAQNAWTETGGFYRYFVTEA